jgi:Ion channel
VSRRRQRLGGDSTLGIADWVLAGVACAARIQERQRWGECTGVPMERLAEVLLVVSGTVALQVVAQAVVLTSVRFIGSRTRAATEVWRVLWVSLGAVVPLFVGHLAQVGLWAGFFVLLGALQSYGDSLYFSLVTFATLGYGDIVLAPDYRILGAMGAACGSLMFGWSTALIFAAISRAIDRDRA